MPNLPSQSAFASSGSSAISRVLSTAMRRQTCCGTVAVTGCSEAIICISSSESTLITAMRRSSANRTSSSVFELPLKTIRSGVPPARRISFRWPSVTASTSAPSCSTAAMIAGCGLAFVAYRTSVAA